MKPYVLAVAIAAGAAAIAVGVVLTAAPGGAPPPEARTGGLPDNFGIIINPPSQETSIRELDSLYRRAAELGASRSNVYVFWDRIETGPGEYDWSTTDAIMSLHKNHGLKATLFFSLINGKTLGPLPDWRGHPTLDALRAEDLASVIGDIVGRYGGLIDTVIMAGDTDVYFEANPGLVDDYNELFEDVRGAVAEEHPGTRMANSFSLDRVLIRGNAEIVSSVSAGDFVAFTYRPVNLLNEISKTTQEALDDLERMSVIAGGGRVALFEVGWSASEGALGTEEGQAAFASALADYAGEEDDLEFATWYRLHDRPEGTCEVAVSEDEGLLQTDSGEYAAASLGAYLCGAGLLDERGEPKPAWDALASR